MNLLRTIFLLLLCCAALPSHFALASKDSVIDLIAEANQPFDERSVDAAIPLPEDRVLAQVKNQENPFWVKTRKEKIERFRCSRCHTGKQSQIQITDGANLAHGDIKVTHGTKDLACTTCHSEPERDFLALEGSGKIDFDHAYQLCGQCHFRQKKDWTAGVHGKRDLYWAGQPVVWSCTECHNPHSPRFEKRWPKTYSKPLGR